MSMLWLMPLRDESGNIEFVGAVMDASPQQGGRKNGSDEDEGNFASLLETIPAFRRRALYRTAPLIS